MLILIFRCLKTIAARIKPFESVLPYYHNHYYLMCIQEGAHDLLHPDSLHLAKINM